MALYTKIEGEVGYTVVGNPTIENGIVSNFSNSNYLKSAQAPTNITSYEIQLKFKTTAFNNRRVIGDSTTNIHSVQLCVPSNDNGTVWYGHPSSSHGWQGIQGRNAISVDTWYWFKAIWTGTKVTIYISTNGKKWLEDGSYTTSTCGWDQAVAFGYDQGNTLTGSIDLNECYIKINSQVWFGNYNYKVKVRNAITKYTVIGNPTISNGIASEFSASNYLKTLAFSPGNKPWEMVYKFTTGSSVSSQYGIVTNLGTGDSVAPLYIGSSSSLNFFLSSNGTSWNITNNKPILTVQANTTYKIKLEFTGSAYNAYSFENNQWVLKNTVTSSTSIYGTIPLVFGNNRATGYAFNGTIDLNESYIKINNYYFWKGSYQNINAWKIHQDNFSKYYTIVDGKLMWANPNIYLKYTTDDTNGWFDTGIKGDLNTEINCKLNRENTGGQALWGYGTSTASISMYSSSSLNCRFSDKTVLASNLAIPDNEITYIKQNKTAVYINNIIKYTYNATTEFTTTGNLLLFRVSGNTNNTFSGKIYYFTILKNNIKLRHFVPVPKGLLIGNFVVPSNGMFDIVEQKFYENKGTGNFTIGGIPEDYIIEGSKLLWCNPNIYLQSDGGKYIDTGIKPTNLTAIEGRVVLTTINKCIYGSRTSKTANDIHDWIVNTATANFPQFGSDDGSVTFSWNLNQIYKIKNGQDGAYVDDISIKNYATYTFTSTLNMYLFGVNQNGSLESRSLIGRIYNFQIKENNKLVRYFLPVNTNTVIGSFTVPAPGMWDAVTKTFYPNKGTGTFTYGKDE